MTRKARSPWTSTCRFVSLEDEPVKARIFRFCRTSVLFWVLVPSIPVAAEAPVAFSTAAGEAWTFRKRLEVAVKPGACDAVDFKSPLGSTTVPVGSGRGQAGVLLDAGDNDVQAQCLADGTPRGDPVAQHWIVRARDVPVARVRLRVTEAEILLDAGAAKPRRHGSPPS
jgi:hypothetical protein